MGQTAGVTTPAIIALIVAAVFGVANWWSRWRADRPSSSSPSRRRSSRLIVAAVSIDPADPSVRAWFVAALVLSLAGDVFLLGDDRWFMAGLVSFLAGHGAYIAGFVAGPTWRWWAGVAALVPVAVLVATAGRRIVAGAQERDARLIGPVVAYLTIISAMFVAAAAAGNGWAVMGAGLFVASDTILGWNRFVRAESGRRAGDHDHLPPGPGRAGGVTGLSTAVPFRRREGLPGRPSSAPERGGRHASTPLPSQRCPAGRRSH